MALTFNAAAEDLLRRGSVPTTPQLWTMAMWVKPHALNVGPVGGVNPSGSLLLMDAQSGGWVLREGSTVRATTGAAPTLDVWHFVAVRVNGTACAVAAGTESNSVSLYTGTLGTLPGTPYQFWIGSQYYGTPNSDLAYCRLWNAALTTEELEAERVSSTPVRTANLVAHWPLSTVATRLDDTSGNGQTLTANGAGPWSEVSGPQFGTVSNAVGSASMAMAGAAVGASVVQGQAVGSASMAMSGAAVGAALAASAGAAGVTASGAAVAGFGGLPWTVAMPRVSLSKPVYGTGTVARANDNGYGYQDDPGSWGVVDGSWVAIQVGAGPSQVLVGLSSDQTGGSYTANAFPAYRLQTSSNSTNGVDGTWTTRVTVTGNGVMAREHLLAFTGESWVKLIVDDAGDATSIDELDVWDASAGTPDTFAIVGDSIADGWVRRWTYFGGGNTPSFQSRCETKRPGHYPLQLNCGATGQAAAYWAANIATVLALHPDVEHWLIAIGMNDGSSMPSGLTAYRANMTTVLEAIVAAGRTPILARVTWTGATSYGGGDVDTCGLRYLNDNGVDWLVANVAGVVRGPDLYALSYAHRVEWVIEADPHPNTTGQKGLSEAWAEWVAPAIASYGTASVAVTGAAVGSSTATAVGAAAATATGAAVGGALAAGAGAATAAAAGSAVGVALAAGAGAASAALSGSAVGAFQAGSSAVGSASVAVSGAAVGAALSASVGGGATVFSGAAVGAAAASGAGVAAVVASGAAVGAGVSAAVGSAAVAVSGAATGAATAGSQGVGLGEVTASGAGVGAATAVGAGTATVAVSGAAAGGALAAGAGSAAMVSAGAAVGASDAAGQATGSASVSVSGAAVGSSTAVGAGSAVVALSGLAVSGLAGVGTGAASVSTSGAAVGAAAVSGAGLALVSSLGEAVVGDTLWSRWRLDRLLPGGEFGLAVDSVGGRTLGVVATNPHPFAPPPLSGSRGLRFSRDYATGQQVGAGVQPVGFRFLGRVRTGGGEPLAELTGGFSLGYWVRMISRTSRHTVTAPVESHAVFSSETSGPTFGSWTRWHHLLLASESELWVYESIGVPHSTSSVTVRNGAVTRLTGSTKTRVYGRAWTHVAVTLRPTGVVFTAAGGRWYEATRRLYLNGTLVDSATSYSPGSPDYSAAAVTEQRTSIGGRWSVGTVNGWTVGADLEIADLRVDRRPWGAGEVARMARWSSGDGAIGGGGALVSLAV